MPFNEGQLKAIQQRNSSILVSAPAGSGKTKILVTRIVELLKEGYSINDFLVVTFTEAAGNEMKQRLSEDLNSLISNRNEDIDYEHIEKQIQDLPNAYITNFHGFCSLLLKKYGYLVDIMPGFSINSDPDYIRKEVLQDCLQQWTQDEQYKEFLSLYFPGYNLEAFETIFLALDDLSHSIDNFYQYVEDIHDICYKGLMTSLEEWKLFDEIKHLFYVEAIEAMDKLTELRYYAQENNLSDFYDRPEEQTAKNQTLMIPYEALYDYLDNMIKELSKEITYDTLVSLVNSKPDRTYNMSWKEVDENVKKTFNKLKTDVLASLSKATSTYLDVSVEEFITKMNISYNAIELMISKGNMLDQFQYAYSLRKKDLNQLDFADLEKYAHKLLEPQYGIVQKLNNRLREIMVDEYQDTNQIQESLLLKIAKHDKEIPLFMVGDMKQSIYRFRQADPQIFLNKYQSFSVRDEDCLKTKTKRIDLVFNYRSCKVVLDSINYIFNAIMDTNIGGLEYYLDNSARLNYDYVGKENGHKEEARERFFKDRHLSTEVLVDVYDPKSSLDKDQYEAHMVAQKIIKLKEEFRLNNEPISYKDIVVLMRSTTSFITFKKVFDLYHIPNHIVLSQGLLSSNEVITVLSTLKAISNPYDDVSLLSMLTAPYTFSYVDECHIAECRIGHKDISLYESLQLSSHESIIKFLESFEYLRNYSYSHSPYELVLELYKLSDYLLFVSQLINGEQRKANLELLLNIINDIQKDHSYLKDTLDILENSSDYAPGSIASDNNDTVEFMTIHKSKGLEFPIVFVCNMHKKFNTQDSKERLIIDKSLGYALKPRIRVSDDKYKDVIVEYENPYRNVIARSLLNESINEEMRILYVALTRASSKLILTGMIKDMKEIVDLQQKLLVNQSPDVHKREGAENVLLYDRLRKTNNYLYWVLSAILRHPDIINQCKNIPELKERALKLESYHLEKYNTFDSTEHAMFDLMITNDQTIEEHIPEYSYNQNELGNVFQEVYDNYVYPHDTSLKKTIAVTSLVHTSNDHYHDISNEDENTLIKASDKGTLVHLLMSYLSFNNDDIDTTVDMLFNEDLIDHLGKEVLLDYKKHIQDFIDSDCYEMISQASHIYKEKPFSYYDGQNVIHGIFDLVFVYNDEIYVLDYKTDRVSHQSSNQSLIKKHEIQLNYYKKVLKEMYNKDTKAIVYYLHINKYVQF